MHPVNPNLLAKSKKIFCSEEIWYTKEVIGKNTLVNITKQISSKAGLIQVYTNYFVTASTITHLNQICSIVKHKSESSLSHYISYTTDGIEASRILSHTLITLSTDKKESPYHHSPSKQKLKQHLHVMTYEIFAIESLFLWCGNIW